MRAPPSLLGSIEKYWAVNNNHIAVTDSAVLPYYSIRAAASSTRNPPRLARDRRGPGSPVVGHGTAPPIRLTHCDCGLLLFEAWAQPEPSKTKNGRGADN